MIRKFLAISLALIARRYKSRKKYDSKMSKKSKLKMLIFNFSYKGSIPSDSYPTFFRCLFKANVRIYTTKYSLSCFLRHKIDQLQFVTKILRDLPSSYY